MPYRVTVERFTDEGNLALRLVQQVDAPTLLDALANVSERIGAASLADLERRLAQVTRTALARQKQSASTAAGEPLAEGPAKSEEDRP